MLFWREVTNGTELVSLKQVSQIFGLVWFGRGLIIAHLVIIALGSKWQKSRTCRMRDTRCTFSNSQKRGASRGGTRYLHATFLGWSENEAPLNGPPRRYDDSLLGLARHGRG